MEGCRGVLEYDTDVVRVRAGRMTLRFTGRCLVIRCLTADSLVVEGFITGLNFSPNTHPNWEGKDCA